MFAKLKLQTDIYIYYYKCFVLNYYFDEYLNDKINYNDYYNLYNAHYMNQITLYNFL